MKSIIVIGSGLSAVGAIKRLIEDGFRPTVLDYGMDPPNHINQLKYDIRKNHVYTWNRAQRELFAQLSQYQEVESLPTKTFLGSRYFYGTSLPKASIESVGPIPPFSYAKGGLSIGWGAAVLPPKHSDIESWPINYNELINSIETILKDLPLCASNDELNEEFPLLSTTALSINSSLATQDLLYRLRNKLATKPNRFSFGEARLLLDLYSGSSSACKYCGECMSGCAFDSIYKSKLSIDKWIEQGLIKYQSGVLVQKLFDDGEVVRIHATAKDGSHMEQVADHVFLAAGAVNSFRIIAQSSNTHHVYGTALTRGGFVLPILTLKRLQNDWPHTNTMPSLFVETRPTPKDRWIHIQLSLHNELFIRKIQQIPFVRYLNRDWFFDLVSSHIFLAFVSLHSDYAGRYKLELNAPGPDSAASKLFTTYSKPKVSTRRKALIWLDVLRIFLSIGCIPLFLLARRNNRSYHVAGTLPMNKYPDKPLTTDPQGRPYGFHKVNVVDSSTYPCLPGTTIGLILMGNAYRIVKQLSLRNNG